jgi:serine/threonine-protein kinase
MRSGRIFFILVLLVCVIETMRLWYITPAQMAAHFNVQGNPDHFTTKEQFFSFELQTMLVVIGLGVLTQVFVAITPVERVNMPNREYWLAPEHRKQTIGLLGSFAATISGFILLAIQAGFELSVSANLHQPILFDAQAMFVVIAGFFVIVILMLFWLAISFRVPPSKP